MKVSNTKPVLRATRNAVLRLIGLRYQRVVHNHIDGDENEGAIELTTFENRPWWPQARQVETKPVSWEKDYDE